MVATITPQEKAGKNMDERKVAMSSVWSLLFLGSCGDFTPDDGRVELPSSRMLRAWKMLDLFMFQY